MARYPFDSALVELDASDLVPDPIPRLLPPRAALPPLPRLPAPPALPRTRSSLPPAPYPRHLQPARTPLPPLPLPSHLPARVFELPPPPVPSFASPSAFDASPSSPSYDSEWDSSPVASEPSFPRRSDPAFASYPPTAITLPPSAAPQPPVAAPIAPRPVVDRRTAFAAAAGVALGALLFSVALGASVADASPSPAKLNASRGLAPTLAAASIAGRELASDAEQEPAVVDAESLPLLDQPHARAAHRAPAHRTSAHRSATKPSRQARATGRAATLNFNSFPVATVLVDGRPVGSTPLRGVRVPAGKHFVVFASPSHGRKVASVSAAAGSNKTLVVRFDQ